jgi:hypothetical protein
MVDAHIVILFCFYTNECWDWVGSPTSCLAGPGFRYQPRDLPSWMGSHDFPQLFQNDTWSYVTMASLPIHCTSLFTGHRYCLLVCSLHLYLVFVITCAARQKSLILKNTCSMCFYPENCGQLIISSPPPHTRTHTHTHTHIYTEWNLFCTGVFLKPSDWVGGAVGCGWWWWWWLWLWLYYTY